jgi:GTPase SAR1 family protein
MPPIISKIPPDLITHVKDNLPRIHSIQGKDIVLVIGNTKSGKSTLINYLLGTRYKRAEQEDGSNVAELRPGTKTEVAHVGVTPDSETLSPAAFAAYENGSSAESAPPPTDILPRIEGLGEASSTVRIDPQILPKSGIIYCDTPGFDDTRNKIKRICATGCTQMSIEISGRITAIVVLIDIEGLYTSTLNELRTLTTNIKKILNFSKPESAEKITPYIIFCFTKNDTKKIKDNQLLVRIRSLIDAHDIRLDDNPNGEEKRELLEKNIFLNSIIASKNRVILDIFDEGASSAQLADKVRAIQAPQGIPKTCFTMGQQNEWSIFQQAFFKIIGEGKETLENCLSLPLILHENRIQLDFSKKRLAYLQGKLPASIPLEQVRSISNLAGIKQQLENQLALFKAKSTELQDEKNTLNTDEPVHHRTLYEQVDIRRLLLNTQPVVGGVSGGASLGLIFTPLGYYLGWGIPPVPGGAPNPLYIPPGLGAALHSSLVGVILGTGMGIVAGLGLLIMGISHATIKNLLQSDTQQNILEAIENYLNSIPLSYEDIPYLSAQESSIGGIINRDPLRCVKEEGRYFANFVRKENVAQVKIDFFIKRKDLPINTILISDYDKKIKKLDSDIQTQQEKIAALEKYDFSKVSIQELLTLEIDYLKKECTELEENILLLNTTVEEAYAALHLQISLLNTADELSLLGFLQNPLIQKFKKIYEEYKKLNPKNAADPILLISPYYIPSNQIECDRDNQDNYLGRGAFGSVYKAHWKKLENLSIPVALKGAMASSITPEIMSGIVKEAQVMKNLKHPNILQLHGVVREGEGQELRYSLVLELMWNSLDNILGQTDLAWATRINIAEQVCNGLVYLHASTLIHRDIKCANVLLTKNNDHYFAKLSDFGMTKPALQITGTRSTYAYMSPELGDYGQATFSSDIFALGMTFVEIANHGIPYIFYTDRRETYNEIIRNRNIPFPSNIPDDFAKLARHCLQYKPEDRPSAPECVKRISNISCS